MKNFMSLSAMVSAAVVILAGSLAYGGWRYSVATGRLRQSLEERAAVVVLREGQIDELSRELSSVRNENKDLAEALEREKGKNEDFDKQIKKISSTVGTLEKLSKTDPELLQKYSKVYFLNENYFPAKLADIPTKYVSSEDKHLQFHGDALSFLEDMLDDAADDDVEIQAASAYRSFYTQSALKAGYAVTYGSGANKFSADQGYSEHQLGTAVDFTSAEIAGGLAGFEKTAGYEWLLENAHKYGFILSYPQGNAFYQFEPWHWRFVGEDLARRLHREGLNFYDMDQREIDKYLVSIFD